MAKNVFIGEEFLRMSSDSHHHDIIFKTQSQNFFPYHNPCLKPLPWALKWKITPKTVFSSEEFFGMSSYQNHHVKNLIPKLLFYHCFDHTPILKTLKPKNCLKIEFWARSSSGGVLIITIRFSIRFWNFFVFMIFAQNAFFSRSWGD